MSYLLLYDHYGDDMENEKDEFIGHLSTNCPYLCGEHLDHCVLMPKHIQDCRCVVCNEKAQKKGRTVIPAPNFQPPAD